jgi:outer membrane lipopolysaccharide assembly protein LptE/RlpB
VKARALAVAAALALSACGYALVGRGAATDPSIKKIGVPTFKDTTAKPALDQKITQKVIEELLKRGHFDVVQTATGVDAVVEGELVSYSVVPVGFSEEGTGANKTQASRYAISLTARVKYSKVGAEEPIWATDSFQFRDEYDIGSDPATFFDREDQALDRLATSFARNLVAAMLEAF